MPTTALTRADFERKLARLERLKKRVAQVLRPAVEAYLDFAREYRALYEAAERSRRELVKERLGIDDYQHQRLMAIAETSKTLLGFRRALPPAMEPLYEVARIARRDDGEDKLRAAIETDRLTPTSGIREIRLIRTGTRRAKRRRASATNTITLTLECDETRLAELLAELLEGDSNARIVAESQSVVDATKHAVVLRYGQHARGHGETVPKEPPVKWSVQAAYEQLDKGTKPSGTRADDVIKNSKHPYHSETVPNAELAARLKASAEKERWLVPEIGLSLEHYAPELKQRQDRISKR